MATHQELQHVCDRLIQGAQEFRQHVIALANLQREIQAAQSTLAGLQAQVNQAQIAATQADEVHQHLRSKRAELAELNAEIARKHEAHGKIDGDLRTLMRKAAALTEPAA